MPDPGGPPLVAPGLQPKAAQLEGLGDPLGLVGLRALMDLTSGSPEVEIGLIDGPVASGHPDLASDRIRQLSGASDSVFARANGDARTHGTFVAGMLSARRSSTVVQPVIETAG